MAGRVKLALLGGIAATLGLLVAGPATAAPPPLEPIEIRRVPLPPGVTSMAFPAWAADGEHIVVGFTSVEEPDAQIAVVRPDGSGFRCLTCGLEQIVLPDRPFNAGRPLNLGKPFVFTDGKRVLVRQPGREDVRDTVNPIAGPTADYHYFVLECEPSVVDCDTPQLVPLELPGGGLTRGVQNREGRISPDTRWFAWTEVMFDGTRMSLGRLVREANRYVVEGVRVLNPRFTLGSDSRDWAVAGPLYEHKEFSPDGRYLTYASFVEAENYDSFELDLLTGERRRLTTDIEWNENASISPDGRWFVNGSSRTKGRMAPFAQLPRPPFIDFAAYVLIGRFQLNDENRTCLLDQWLVGRSGEAGSYFGQPLVTGLPPGWGTHGPGRWNPDGTRYVLWERSHGAAATPEDPDARAIVAHFPARRPQPPPADRTTPDPAWAVPREEWDGFADTQGVFTVPGRASGTATISLSGGVNSMVWSAEYDGYSDDGRSVLDGTERVDSPFTIAYGRWEADLRLSGAHTGSLKADVTVRTGGQGSGSVESELDGRRFAGLPSSDCEPLATPALQARVRRRGGRRRTRLVVAVTARVPGDAAPRPVRAATVTFGRRRAVTGETGRARIVLRGRQRRLLRRRSRSARTIRIEAAGFVPVHKVLRRAPRVRRSDGRGA